MPEERAFFWTLLTSTTRRLSSVNHRRLGLRRMCWSSFRYACACQAVGDSTIYHIPCNMCKPFRSTPESVSWQTGLDTDIHHARQRISRARLLVNAFVTPRLAASNRPFGGTPTPRGRTPSFPSSASPDNLVYQVVGLTIADMRVEPLSLRHFHIDASYSGNCQVL